MAKKAGKIPDECVSEKPGTKNALRMRRVKALCGKCPLGSELQRTRLSAI